ncbi:MAG: D-glycero-beta-D-manno-heptose-7-phosphate kinase, partial [Chitinophagaceae bacterium]|nr:D-glycero-beta-D-manno-heptose-7-phosphate kinase [Chitinophagaceae bacterium]
MIKISKERLLKLKKSFDGLKIAVIGDMMLDCYYWGDVKRVSPEAPVPIVEVENEFYRFGGAANVALNIKKLGGIPIPIGVIGYDNEGSIFSSLIEEEKIASAGLVIDDGRPTTSKARVIAHNQHVVRIDKEKKNPVDSAMSKRLLDYFKSRVDELDGIILQDY